MDWTFESKIINITNLSDTIFIFEKNRYYDIFNNKKFKLHSVERLNYILVDNIRVYITFREPPKEVIDKDGWLHTGDLALKDAEGNITIKGRSKNLLLSASGQNIYPEEIEDKLNNLPYVAESIIVQQNEKLVGLVYPDFDDAFAHGLKNEDIERVMEENRVALNAMLPAYSQISKMKIYPEEFEKTPKKSIKRYLYQEAKG